MRRAFTLLELLVVIAIMGMLGAASVGGYRAMQRGMEERGVMQNVNEFMRTAYARAQIDRQPVYVVFWNETRQAYTDTDTLVVVGRAVAVRRSGRVTYADGNYVGDEFADLRFNRLLDSEGEEDTSGGSESKGKGAGVYLYRMNGDEGKNNIRSLIAKNTVQKYVTATPLNRGRPSADANVGKKLENLVEKLDNEHQMKIGMYAYQLLDANGVTWQVGDAYGFEFAEIELPRNYIFGTTFKEFEEKVTSDPIEMLDPIRFKVSDNTGSGADSGLDGAYSVDVSVLRQQKGSYKLKADKVGKSDNPAQDR